MQTKRLNWLFVTLVPVIMLVVGVFNSAETIHADDRAVIVPFVALAGDGTLINSVASPFIASGDLKFVREYPNPGDYLFESPTPIPAPVLTTPDLQIRMFQVTTDHVHVQTVLNAVVAAAMPHNAVHPITGESLWLSYVPKQVVIHGHCQGTGSVNTIFNTFDNDINQVQLINMDYLGGGAGASECVGLFSIQTAKRVDELVSAAGASAANARMEPNFLTGGTMGGYSTFGSPAAMLPGAPTTSTAGTSPISTTGKNVGVYIFDTSPYNGGGVFSEIVNSKPISVVHGGGIVLPSSMPFRPMTTVAAHGTFVATPIVEWAPDSHINLVRALSQDAIGTEFALVQATDWAIKDALTPGRDFTGVVFNYSLGLEDKVGDLQKTAVERMVNIMHTVGVVQVAAAGNDSAYETMPMPTNLPASNANVMGVTALVPGNHIACYANQPRTSGRGFAARGGGAARGVTDCDVDAFVAACAAGGSGCLHGWDPSSPTKFAYGIGTSFAAPHVAAFAAQIIEAKAAAPRAAQTWITPADVAEEIQRQATANGEDMGDGYISGYASAPAAATLTEIGVSEQAVPLIAIFTLVVLMGGTFVIRGYNRVHDES